MDEAARRSVCPVAVWPGPPGSIALLPETVSSPWTAAADTQTLERKSVILHGEFAGVF